MDNINGRANIPGPVFVPSTYFYGARVTPTRVIRQFSRNRYLQYPDQKLRFYEPINGAVCWTDMVGRKVDGIPIECNMSDMYHLI
ncbi:hypothetical protein [Legionella sp. 227]|uniref:hypothetical protein n=1 Tax=Legionella sp. 227 TaxID=3367288 RepID=UPI00370DB9FD